MYSTSCCHSSGQGIQNIVVHSKIEILPIIRRNKQHKNLSITEFPLKPNKIMYVLTSGFSWNSSLLSIMITAWVQSSYLVAIPKSHANQRFSKSKWDNWNPSIFNILRWVTGLMGQTTHRQSIWCSKYFFHNFLQNSLQK